MLSEPIAYPLVLAAIATGVRALDRPSVRSIAIFLGFVFLASFARLQFAVSIGSQPPIFESDAQACAAR